jgi:hypothetical protein
MERKFMNSDQRWILPIVLVCGAAVAAAVAADARRHRRLQVKMQEKVAVQTWEGEGGRIRTGTMTPVRSSASPAPGSSLIVDLGE